MYKTVLVTLDRSTLAEQALGHAVAMAKAFDAALEVLSVVPVIDRDDMLAAGVNIDWDREVAEFEEYLVGVLAQLEEDGVQAHSEVRRGDIAEEILRHADEMHADMIVMSTHGRSGLGRWVYGSIADRVLRHATVPVLLVRATER